MARFQSELRLVDAVAGQVRREMGDALEMQELVSFGQEGLFQAARRYDPDRGIPFAKFAYYRVRGAMLDGMRSHGALSRRMHEKLRALQAAHLMTSGFYEDTRAAVGGGLSEEAADERLSDELASLATAMAVGFVGHESSVQEGQRVEVDRRLPDAQMEEGELLRLVHEELDKLPEAEAELVRRHFLHDEFVEDIAADLGLSKSWGSRLMSRGIQRLSKRLRKTC